MLWSLAFAAPEVVTTDSNGVHATVVVDAPIDRVRADVFDPELMVRIDGSGTTASVVGRRGPCKVVEQVSPNAFKTVTYTVALCPTADGVHGTLIESNLFTRYDVRWTLEPVDGGGTRMVYALEMDQSLMVPQFLINRTTRKAVLHMMNQLMAHYRPG